MPAEQEGQPYQLRDGRWGLRYYDRNGVRRRTIEKFTSPSKARKHFRDVIARGDITRPNETLAEFVEIYLRRHAANVRPERIQTLRYHLAPALTAYGDVPLTDLEQMVDELADWQAGLPATSRHDYVRALRQALDAAKRWRRITTNPAKAAGPNPAPGPRQIRAYTFPELDALTLELSPAYQPLPPFGAATGLRPEEWAALERRDIDRRHGVLTVRRTVVGGDTATTPLRVIELAKTDRSRRQVPLSPRALTALDQLPPRLDTPLLFAAPEGGPLRLRNFRRREWNPAVEASGIARPARIYDLRSTFASNAIAARVDLFELARVMGTSTKMIERHYGVLLTGAARSIADRLANFEANDEQEANER